MENNEKLSGAQKMVRFFSSKSKFEKIKAESMQWKFTCECGKESSVWEVGGVRSGAKGKPSVYLKCPACGNGGMRKLSR